MRRGLHARSVDGVKKLAVIGLAVVCLAVAAPCSAGRVNHPGGCYGSAWQRRAGGISELVSCGSRGVSGTRTQFVEAVTRPVDQPFLRQLRH
jgi:hypothetical protein